jgi:hypothetical protein
MPSLTSALTQILGPEEQEIGYQEGAENWDFIICNLLMMLL